MAPDLLRSGEKEIERLTFVEASVLDTKSPSYRKIIHKPSAGGHVLGLQSEDRLMVVIGGLSDVIAVASAWSNPRATVFSGIIKHLF